MSCIQYIDIVLLFLQLWVAYAPCGAQHKDAVQVTLEQIDLIKRLVETYPNQLQLVKTSEGMNIAFIICTIIVIYSLIRIRLFSLLCLAKQGLWSEIRKWTRGL